MFQLQRKKIREEINAECIRIWKVILTSFSVIFQHWPGYAEKNHVNPRWLGRDPIRIPPEYTNTLDVSYALLMTFPALSYCAFQIRNEKWEPGECGRYSDYATGWTTGVRFSLHSVQTGFVAHPASYPMVTGGSVPGGKAAGYNSSGTADRMFMKIYIGELHENMSRYLSFY
jgi:hypothetical protein